MQTKTTRLALIDTLRGAALLGVLIVHIIGEFGGWGAMMPKAKMEALPTADSGHYGGTGQQKALQPQADVYAFFLNS